MGRHRKKSFTGFPHVPPVHKLELNLIILDSGRVLWLGVFESGGSDYLPRLSTTIAIVQVFPLPASRSSIRWHIVPEGVYSLSST